MTGFANGAQAEYCAARAVHVAAKPRSLDHVAATVTPISALTAWQGLIERSALAPEERVLIHGAAGGVGAFAVQVARLRRAYVIGTASAHNLQLVRGLGADQLIDRRAERFEDVVGPVDVVFDTVGGETLARSWPENRRQNGHDRGVGRTDSRAARTRGFFHRRAERRSTCEGGKPDRWRRSAANSRRRFSAVAGSRSLRVQAAQRQGGALSCVINAASN